MDRTSSGVRMNAERSWKSKKMMNVNTERAPGMRVE